MSTDRQPSQPEARCLGCQRCHYGKLYPCPSQTPAYQPVPEWVRRAQAGRLPAKDTTGQAY